MPAQCRSPFYPKSRAARSSQKNHAITMVAMPRRKLTTVITASAHGEEDRQREKNQTRISIIIRYTSPTKYVIVLILLKAESISPMQIAAADRRAKWEISTDHMSCIFESAAAEAARRSKAARPCRGYRTRAGSCTAGRESKGDHAGADGRRRAAAGAALQALPGILMQ